MSSQFGSVLTDLDGSLQIIRSQLDRLQAALEVDDNKLRITLTEANQQVVKLRELIRAERPDADWTDRGGLDQLVHELEIASTARLYQQRRAKLLALANELDAGRVQHRFDSRTTTLNRLRLEAVQALRTEAARTQQLKDLPGPNASEWLHWACNLRDAKDGLVLTTLRRDFGAAECFVGEMEESYWIPGEPVHESSEPSESAIRSEEELVTESLASSFSVSAAPPGAKEDRTGEGRIGTLAVREVHSRAELQPNTVTSPEPAVAEPAGRTSIDRSQEVAKKEFEGPNVALPGFLSAEVEAPSSFGESILNKKRAITWAVAAALFVAVGIFAVIYYLHARNGSKSNGTAATAGAELVGTLQDSDIQKDIERRLATLKASSIQVTVHDGIVTLAGRSSPDEEVHAMTLALQAKGVKDVKSELQIQAQDPKPHATSTKGP